MEFCFFIEDFVAGTRDSDKFANPYITEINTTINGIPHRLNSKGIFGSDFWEDLLKRFNNNLSQKDFFDTKFGIWLDFRTFPGSNEIHGSGLKLDSSNGIQISLRREKGGSGGDFTCYLFVVSDGVFNVMNNTLHSITY